MTQKIKGWEVFIPFVGFYCSTHDGWMDDAIDSFLEGEDEGKTSDGLDIDYPGFMKEYAKQYVEAFEDYMSEEHGIIVTAKFMEVDSPAEYNFLTDRIVAEIDEDSLLAIIAKVDFPRLKQEVFDTLKCRDGFRTSRSNDLAVWLFRGVYDWDTVELGILLDHFVDFNAMDVPLEPDNAHEIAHEFISWSEENK